MRRLYRKPLFQGIYDVGNGLYAALKGNGFTAR